jgi:AraC-like DNA-binding protein
MSKMRHLLRAYSVGHPPGAFTLPTAPGWHQLLYASRGVLSVHTGSGTWAVPRDRAAWIPADDVPEVVVHGRAGVRALYLPAELWDLTTPCRVVAVPPLLRELILHLARVCPLDLSVPAHRRLADVLVDHVVDLPDAPLRLPMPTDPRALAVANALLVDPGRADLADAAASRRTVERHFLVETGLTLGRWRRRARIIEALRRLAEGEPVTEVALAVGYATPSAFTAMFHTETGTTPSAYAAGHSREAVSTVSTVSTGDGSVVSAASSKPADRARSAASR